MGFLANFSCKKRRKIVLVKFFGCFILFQTANAFANAVMAPNDPKGPFWNWLGGLIATQSRLAEKM